MAADPETLVPILDPSSRPLDRSLHRLDSFLSLLGFVTFASASPPRIALSCSAFVVWGIAAPSAAIYLSRRSSCSFQYQVEWFEICDLVSQASLAAVSLVCISKNLYKFGIRKFMFVDPLHGEVQRFQNEYVRKIQDFFRLLLWWILPCFIIKTAREISRSVCIFHDSLWRSSVVLLASVLSWVYLTVIFLSACILLNLVFNLQVIHFEDYSKLPERDSDTLIFLEEHARLRYNLSKISHRFRIFLLLVFSFISTSQCVMLFQTTGYSEKVNFLNAGNLAVSSIVQVVGVVLCLHSAAKITHKAQGVAAIASNWHAWITCSSECSHSRGANGSGNLGFIPAIRMPMVSSESDLESLDNVTLHNTGHMSPYLPSYHKRQALVLYLQSNPGGITIFGWAVDRGLINTIFFIELSLVLFVLGKTVVLAK